MTAMKPPTPTTAMIEAGAVELASLNDDPNWHDYLDDARSVLEAALAAAPHPTKPQPALSEEALALREATSLAVALYNAHYRGRAPNWKPLPDLRGVISQIDNMTTGLTLIEALSSQRAEGIEEGLDYGPGSPWSEGYHSGHAAGWRAGVRADILRLLRADLAEEDAERHAQRIAVIDDALTQDAG